MKNQNPVRSILEFEVLLPIQRFLVAELTAFKLGGPCLIPDEEKIYVLKASFIKKIQTALCKSLYGSSEKLPPSTLYESFYL